MKSGGPNQFPEYGTNYSFPLFEEKILKFWKDNKVFERSLEGRKNKKQFYFYDGPPFATGLPHYGHILAGTIKDVVVRYWSMRGYYAPSRFGWDTHGLPVEFEMEKTLGLNGSLDIQKYGVGKFNEACRSIVLRYVKDWRGVVERMGRWIDMDNDYKTMDPKFMESVWWVFKQLWEKGHIYEGKKIVPYSWRLTAPLSNFEASLNYKDIQDPAITVLLPLLSNPTTALAIWTTTPWTLPANLAVAIQCDSSKVTYARYKLPTPVGKTTHVIMATQLAEKYGFTDAEESITAKLLLGQFYEPLFSCYVNAETKKDNAFRVLDGSHFVTATDGTGMVHMAPSFGEDDYYLCQKEKINAVDPTDMQGNFTSAVSVDARLQNIVGVNFKEADKHIIKVLKDGGRLMKHDVLQHAYPFCERSDTPLMYKAISSWFVKVEDIKDRMVANNKKIYWVPEHIKEGRFGRWLENARDWCISRNRFWGTPIPVWRCKNCDNKVVVGSSTELNVLAGKEMPDLHKHFVDDVIGDCTKCGSIKSLTRTPEVLDCWFESGSMPYAQEHYPFENKKKFETSFPADFIAEGLDQTRGWFYTLTVLSTALFDKPAFKNCIVNGMVLAEDGKKMSKRLKNYPDPVEVFSKHGADALRLYLMQSPAMHGDDLRFSEKNMVELQRAVILPLWNAYSFFSSYANIDAWKAPVDASKKIPTDFHLDKWILARLSETEHSIHKSMEDYKLAEVAPALVEFIDDLTNWYIRLNRERFWSESGAETKVSKEAAYSTLWHALYRFSFLLAPYLPFVAETLHAALRGEKIDSLLGSTKSVHEEEYPDEVLGGLSAEQKKIIDEVRLAKQMMLLGRSLRGEAKIGLRQPLSKLRVAGLSPYEKEILVPMKDLILREVNVKNVELVEKASDLVEEEARPNHRVLGKKVGGAIKDIQAVLSKWTHTDIQKFETSGEATILGHRLLKEDVQILRKAKAGRVAVADFGKVAELDTQITPELLREGLMREIVNRIQQRRKEAKLHLADRIKITWSAAPGSLLYNILDEETRSPGYISRETLARSCISGKVTGDGVSSEKFDEHGELSFSIERA